MSSNLRIALKSLANGRFVCADLNDGEHLIANRNAAQQWETFEVYQVNADGTVTPMPEPGPTPPTPTPPNPTPNPPAGTDAIDLHAMGVHWSITDIATWPITVAISSLHMRPVGDSHEGISVTTSPVLPNSWKWPSNPNNPADNYQYTVWACAKDPGGKWNGSGFIQMWQGRPSTGAPILVQWNSDWAYDSRWGPLASFHPKAGDQMAFFISAGDARGKDEVSSVRERSNVVIVTLPAGDRGDFTF